MKNPDELSTATILALAQEKIRDPQHWCRGRLALDAEGQDTQPFGDDAVRWCAAGAVSAVAYTRLNSDVLNALTGAAVRRFGSGIITVNDSSGHAAVMEIYDIAIKETAHPCKIQVS
jgi:hypothetical protein